MILYVENSKEFTPKNTVLRAKKQMANKWTKNHTHYKIETTPINPFLPIRLTKIFINMDKIVSLRVQGGVGTFVHYW